MILYCKECGQPFEGKGKSAYCSREHRRICEVCGSSFIWDYKNPKRCCSRKCSAELRKRTILRETRICELCGKEFHPKSNTQRYCEDDHFNPCPICGNPVKILLEYDPVRCCSVECSNELRKQTCMLRYNVPAASMYSEIREKLHISAISSSNKKIQTLHERYGPDVDNVAQLDWVQDKIRNTVKSEDCIARTQETTRQRWGVIHAMHNSELRSKQARNVKNKSNLEKRLYAFLDEYNIEYESEKTVEKDGVCHTYDVFLPNYNIFVECDGIYWHSYTEDPDGKRVRDDYESVRIFTLPQDAILIVVVESDFESGLKQLQDTIRKVNDACFDYEGHLFSWCRAQGFPYPSYTDDRMISDWNRLKNYNPESYNPYCRIGQSIISNYHKSIWDCAVSGRISPRFAWEDDNLLKKCIANRLIYQNDVDPSKVLYGFSASKLAPKVSIFNPVLARYLTKKYLDDYCTVFDPFSGFSGRMLGVTSTGKNYVGSDLNESAVYEANQIIDFLGLNNSGSVSLHDIFDYQTLEYECLLTCPPYENKEVYNKETEFHSCDWWIDYILKTVQCRSYVFVVDKTQSYSDYIVEELPSKSHFSNNKELVIVIDK